MSVISRFYKNERGAVAILFSIAAIPAMGLMAVAVDYSHVNKNRMNYQSIVDSAALAGATAATDDTDDKRQKRAENWVDAESARLGVTPSLRSATSKSGEVEVKATFLQKSFFNFSWTNDMPVEVRAVAMIKQEITRRVLDVAMCIDATGSMQNTINSVKARAQSFSDDLNKAVKDRNLTGFEYVRIRAIYYRDFAVDKGKVFYPGWGWYGGNAMVKSEFFDMPSKKSQLESFIASESASGGGDEPESSYECINEGMQSKWFKPGDTIPGSANKADEVYPAIIIWSDANALPIPHWPSISSGQYPTDMPKSQADFLAKWNNGAVINQKNRLLVHFGLCNYGSWALARSLTGYMCGGSLSDGNNNMINKIADVMAVRYKNTLTRLSR